MEPGNRSYQDAICGALVTAMCYVKTKQEREKRRLQQHQDEHDGESEEEEEEDHEGKWEERRELLQRYDKQFSIQEEQLHESPDLSNRDEHDDRVASDDDELSMRRKNNEQLQCSGRNYPYQSTPQHFHHCHLHRHLPRDRHRQTKQSKGSQDDRRQQDWRQFDRTDDRSSGSDATGFDKHGCPATSVVQVRVQVRQPEPSRCLPVCRGGSAGGDGSPSFPSSSLVPSSFSSSIASTSVPSSSSSSISSTSAACISLPSSVTVSPARRSKVICQAMPV